MGCCGSTLAAAAAAPAGPVNGDKDPFGVAAVFELGARAGVGGGCEVWQARSRETGRRVALKCITLDGAQRWRYGIG